jgi:acetamidase/formamidase
MAKTHYFPDDRVHYVWDNEQDPIITVDPGDTVVYHTREVSDGQIGRDSDASVLAGLDWDRVYPLAGPIAMAGAEPGDVLAVEVLDIRTQGWGWTAVIPGLGLLPEDFPDAYLQIFDLTNGDYTYFKDDIVIPIEPFFGTMGVSPPARRSPSSCPLDPSAATWTPATSRRARYCTCLCSMRAHSSPAVMRTRRRVTARCA